MQGHQEMAPHPPLRPWTPQHCGEITAHVCPCQITLPQQTLHPGTVPLLQGSPATLGCVMPSGLRAFSFPVLCVLQDPRDLREVQLLPMLHNFPGSRPKAIFSLFLSDRVKGW